MSRLKYWAEVTSFLLVAFVLCYMIVWIMRPSLEVIGVMMAHDEPTTSPAPVYGYGGDNLYFGHCVSEDSFGCYVAFVG